MTQRMIDADALNILGEVLWHSTTSDPSIVTVSQSHEREILKHANHYLRHESPEPIRFLEVAAYAHITGYLLAEKQGWEVTLSDISVETLALGAKTAKENGLNADRVRRVAVDFHDLPFPSRAFDIVYICSALHHTLRWQIVLNELLRVTAGGGILILENEPCYRDFCFYKFATNRPGTFRPVETELDRQGILKTIAEPYPGSRPEMLFGMIENQKMPLSEILDILGSGGTIESLTIDSAVLMSPFDHTILAAQGSWRTLASLPKMVEKELSERLGNVQKFLTETDKALGIKLPHTAEITEMASRVTRRIRALRGPTLWDQASSLLSRAPGLGKMATQILRRLKSKTAAENRSHQIAIAEIFGGPITVIVRKQVNDSPRDEPARLNYAHGSRKGVLIGYPPKLNRVLDLSYDLVPDIQNVSPDQIRNHFAPEHWRLDNNASLQYLIQLDSTARIKPLVLDKPGHLIVLLRVYGAPSDSPFRIELVIDQQISASVDVHQPESFLLRSEGHIDSMTPTIELRIRDLSGTLPMTMPTVTVAAARVVCIPEE